MDSNGELCFPEQLTGISNVINAYSAYGSGGTHFIICSDAVWGWGNNTAGECGGTDKNWYINDDGILIDEGYLNVTSPIKISAGSKYGMFTIGLTTYILDQNGNMSCMGADNYALYQADKETEISLTHNISNIGRTTDDQIIIIYKNGDIIYQRGDSIFYADFSLNNIKNIIDNVVITEDGQAYPLEFNCTDSKDGGNCNDGLKMTALPVNNVKCISGNVDNTYFALKKDDTIWYWNRNDDGSVSEACRLYSESGEIGSGTVIISEEYGKPGTEYYRLGQSQLEEKGWAEIENNNKSGRNQQSAENGEFTASEGRLIINKTSDRSIANTTGEDLIYAVEKTFEYVEDDWQGDAHVTMRTKNFKGKYAVEITGCFKQTDSQVYYDIIGRDSSGNKAVVGRYRSDSGYYGYFSVYNNKLNGANTNRYHLWQDCRITREISTYLDTPEATFKTLLNGSGIACEQLSKGRIPKASFL